MKNLQYLTLFLLCSFILSCAGNESTDESSEPSNESEESVSEERDDVEMGEENEVAEGDVFTAWAVVDGPDESLWVVSEYEYNNIGEEFDKSRYKQLDIIPAQEYRDGYEVCEWMLGLTITDFAFYGHEFGDYTGAVEVFYDGNKHNILARYNVVDGKPDGTVKVWDPEGRLFLDWEYDKGEWIQARTSPYGANWTFDQGQSKLRVIDDENAISHNAGTKVVKLMSTFRRKDNEKNSLYTIMEKASFNNPFLINGTVFTGRLEAYWLGAGVEGQLYYELNFQNGWLDGDVKIYNDWGELELHELFTMGELDTTLYKLDYSQMDGVAKPIIYIYPEKEMMVDVSLHFDGELTHTYPKYQNKWQVLAKTDGTLFDEQGKEYYALYWEGNAREQFTMSEGFVVPGDETVAFLEESLSILGLNRREANEFIVYWLPKLENNPYNLIHFATDEYEQMAHLNIQPKPETLIRVMMVYQPLDAPVDIPIQDLNKISKKRSGYTVVEWGGTQYQEKVLP